MSAAPRLRDLLQVERADVERALAAQARDDGAVALVQRQLGGLAMRAAAERLNETLDVDVFELLLSGWEQVPAVRDGLARSGQSPGKTSVIALGPHEITSTVYPVLAVTMAQAALPELRLTLTLRANFGSATLALSDGRLATVAPRDAAADVRLAYGELLLKQRANAMWQLPDEVVLPDLSSARLADHLGRERAEGSDTGAVERAAVGGGS
jgi:hypothetical protein